jgi:hypothetical protein
MQFQSDDIAGTINCGTQENVKACFPIGKQAMVKDIKV